MRDPNKNVMADVNSIFASVSESEILRTQEDAVPENTKYMKFGLKVFKGYLRLSGVRLSSSFRRCIWQSKISLT